MVSVDVQETPNPRSRRFVLDRTVQESTRGRSHKPGDDVADELIAGILGMEGVTGVLTLPTSITVTTASAADWDDLADRVTAAITAHHS